ncbi:hypothetical protein FACS189413_19220 [Bacteroidia bacterium]|nr:hypothetical protein FACS189463_3730 [Bacteroidia bacterium]GHU74451.1 hypothetical protein FACS189413_19220 [Bacteroidia bacterium]
MSRYAQLSRFQSGSFAFRTTAAGATAERHSALRYGEQGFYRGLFTLQNPFKTAKETSLNEDKIYLGLSYAIASDPHFSSQLPQMALGFLFAMIGNYAGQVDNVSYWGGATVMGGNNWGKSGAVTLGSFIMGGPSIKADPNNSLFQHEYGHYLQSQEMGWGYLTRVGIPSLMSASMNDGNHKYQIFEQDANRRAFMYFNEKVEGFYQTEAEYRYNRIHKINQGWDFYQNPLDVNHIGKSSRKDYYDYNNLTQRALVNSLSLHAEWYDYAGWLTAPFGVIKVGRSNGNYYITNRVK